MWYTNATINILTDFAIIILPMPVIKRLQLGKRPKYALMAIFAVGGRYVQLSLPSRMSVRRMFVRHGWTHVSPLVVVYRVT
jgi:hypothetical protein